MSKPRVIKDYDKLEKNIIQQIKLKYPLGYEKHLIQFKNHKKALISALPFEAEDRIYLVRMSRDVANKIIQEDEDFNDNGQLREASKVKIEKALEKALKKSKDKPAKEKPAEAIKETPVKAKSAKAKTSKTKSAKAKTSKKKKVAETAGD